MKAGIHVITLATTGYIIGQSVQPPLWLASRSAGLRTESFEPIWA